MAPKLIPVRTRVLFDSWKNILAWILYIDIKYLYIPR